MKPSTKDGINYAGSAFLIGAGILTAISAGPAAWGALIYGTYRLGKSAKRNAILEGRDEQCPN
jgi:hypothetical protein